MKNFLPEPVQLVQQTFIGHMEGTALSPGGTSFQRRELTRERADCCPRRGTAGEEGGTGHVPASCGSARLADGGARRGRPRAHGAARLPGGAQATEPGGGVRWLSSRSRRLSRGAGPCTPANTALFLSDVRAPERLPAQRGPRAAARLGLRHLPWTSFPSPEYFKANPRHRVTSPVTI